MVKLPDLHTPNNKNNGMSSSMLAMQGGPALNTLETNSFEGYDGDLVVVKDTSSSPAHGFN